MVAEPGPPFTTLDGQTYTTVGGEVVFENEEGHIIDLPSIKGTLNTAVDDQTQNLLFFIESLDPTKVRFASMTHSIRTVAAQLLEKNVDPELIPEVLARGVDLYQELCGAKVASEVFDEYVAERTLSPVKLPLSRLTDYLGLTLRTQQIETILTDLGCQVTITGSELIATPPSFRPDLTIPADIIEEIARIYGYHNLPSQLMATPIPVTKPENVNFALETQIKHFLSDIGWQEVYTYSLVSQSLAEQSGLAITEHLKLQNPLTDDRVYLRRSLIPSLSEVLDHNSQPTQVSVFEIANCYTPQEGNLPLEQLELTLVSNRPYRVVKGAIEVLLSKFHLTSIIVQPDDRPEAGFSQSGQLVIAGNNPTADQEKIILGKIGTLASGRVAVVIPLSRLLATAKTHPTYQPLPKTAAVIEDLTFTLPEQTLAGNVITTIRQTSQLITSVELHDVYQRNFTFTITYLNPRQNLTKEAVEPIRKQITERITQKFGGQLVGSV